MSSSVTADGNGRHTEIHANGEASTNGDGRLTPELLAIIRAWQGHSSALAGWAQHTIVNRTDVHGYYDGDGGQLTTRKPLDHERLAKHFSGAFIRGIHSTAIVDGQCLCRWLVLDVDRHGEGGDPEANLRFVLAIYASLVSLGFRPLLLDSNGRGGFHVWVIFDRPIPAALARRFGLWLARDWRGQGLDGEPECFPKQDDIRKGKECGNWVRLPGRHHKRGSHRARVWGGSTWLEGTPAIHHILAT